jgi:hypothetical protein
MIALLEMWAGNPPEHELKRRLADTATRVTNVCKLAAGKLGIFTLPRRKRGGFVNEKDERVVFWHYRVWPGAFNG